MREVILYLPFTVAENLYAAFQANFRKEVLKKEKLFRGKDIDALMSEITAFAKAASAGRLKNSYKVSFQYEYRDGKPLPVQFLEKELFALASDQFVYFEISEIMKARRGSFSSPEVDIEVQQLGFI